MGGLTPTQAVTDFVHTQGGKAAKLESGKVDLMGNICRSQFVHGIIWFNKYMDSDCDRQFWSILYRSAYCAERFL